MNSADYLDGIDADERSATIIPSADILSLISSHLSEAGLHETCQTLQKETSVGLPGASPSTTWKQWACDGDWGSILDTLRKLDLERLDIGSVTSQVYAQTIRELAEAGEWDVAHALLRLVQQSLNEQPSTQEVGMTPLRLLEQQMAELAASRKLDPSSDLPNDFYAGGDRGACRKRIGEQLEKVIPVQPTGRLTNLMHQAIKWQYHTGKLPPRGPVRAEDQAQMDTKNTAFDLVSGGVDIRASSAKKRKRETIVSTPFTTISFGKETTCEACLFLPDGSGLVTGSSDGLVEVWDPSQQYKELRMDLVYQKEDRLMNMEHAVSCLGSAKDATLIAAGDTDGMVRVWRVDSGKCLREFRASTSSVTCLAFSKDGSKILSGDQDGKGRETSLRSLNLLLEIEGHSSYLAACMYWEVEKHREAKKSHGLVVTTGGDGMAKLWNESTGELETIIHGHGSGLHGNHEKPAFEAIVSIFPLHTPMDCFIIVPRSDFAVLVDPDGTVIREFQEKGSPFVAAATNPQNSLLYVARDDGCLLVFHVSTGELIKTIDEFGMASSRRVSDDDCPEISAIVYHPSKHLLAAFSNSKSQKKGIVKLWK